MELLEPQGSDFKRTAEFLHVQDAEVRLIPLKVRLRVACVMHEIAEVLVTCGQLHLDGVRLRDPLGVLELRVGDGGSLSDPSPFAVLVCHAIGSDGTHASEEYEVQRRALDELLEVQLSRLGEQVRRASRPFSETRNLATPTLNSGGTPTDNARAFSRE